ncbi:unnamed protein product [Ilex paraguariensis]|uniref:F-box domain-containing protein n=1 Tax=Ilex paraguariensis TaxID=185542 RepID=A0ABC8T0Q5_9AQUA
MAVETSWSDDEFDDNTRGTGVFYPYLGLTDRVDEESNHVPIDPILPDDLQERIIASLPLECILKACCVCKKWNEIVHSKRFMLNISSVLSQKPWYFMFTSSDEPVGYFYDPLLRKWYSSELPCNVKHNCYIASSSGLVCFMDNYSRNELYVCNPLARNYKKVEPLGDRFFDYRALAFSVDWLSHSYTLAIVGSEQISGDEWDISIHIYNSNKMVWQSPAAKTFTRWRAGYDSVICDGVLYALFYYTGTDETEDRHALLTYNICSPSYEDISVATKIPVPCFVTCGRLMNLSDKLVMVGGIGRQDRPGIIKGIGIWVLRGMELEEVSRMPHKFFQGFGEIDDVFASSGAGDLIYIQSYGATALLEFDMTLKQWDWSHKCPVTKKFPLQLFSGFCFQPRLEVSP